jgi:hypothetical protein
MNCRARIGRVYPAAAVVPGGILCLPMVQQTLGRGQAKGGSTSGEPVMRVGPATPGLLSVWNDIDAADEDEFNAWY